MQVESDLFEYFSSRYRFPVERKHFVAYSESTALISGPQAGNAPGEVGSEKWNACVL
jgi:hypothetical protein